MQRFYILQEFFHLVALQLVFGKLLAAGTVAIVLSHVRVQQVVSNLFEAFGFAFHTFASRSF